MLHAAVCIMRIYSIQGEVATERKEIKKLSLLEWLDNVITLGHSSEYRTNSMYWDR